MRRWIVPVLAVLAGLATSSVLQELGASWWGARLGGLAVVVLVIVVDWRRKSRAR